jgi:sugar lactone lactonase YvrE
MHRALCFFLLVFSTFAGAEDFTIQTFAGGGLPQNIQGTSAVFQILGGIVTDANGNAYFTTGSHTVMRLDSNGVLTLVAGNGTPGFSGDGGLATTAQLNGPGSVALDGAGNLYIGDAGNIPAVDALIAAGYIAVDAAGSVYVDDTTLNRIRKISNGVITTIAGNGTFGHSGDGGPATSAQLGQPGAMAFAAAGTLYFLDSALTPRGPIECGCYLRKIQNGVITTLAANISFNAIAVDAAGNIFISVGTVIQEISNGVTTTIAGTLSAPPDGNIGDNGPAIDAFLGEVDAFTIDKNGNIFITAAGLIRKVSNGVITTVAGNISGIGVWNGDSGPAIAAQLSFGGGNGGSMAMDAAGNVYISESNRVRKISQGVITTVAGTEIAGFSGDNGPATDAQLNHPQGIGLDAAGNLYIADSNNLRVRKVSNGIITTIAGNGVCAYMTTGCPATGVGVYPQGLAVSPAGDVYVSQNTYGFVSLNTYQFSQVVLKISDGIVVMVAGNGTSGYSGDGGPATQAQLADPSGLALDEAGNLYIADTGNQVIRKVSNGVITTVAGNFASQSSSSGDGGLATSARLNFPNDVAVDPLGRLYISEYDSEMETGGVRRVSNGIISTVAGYGTSYFTGDGGPAVGASMSPIGVAIGPNGQVYEADSLSSRVRVLTPVPVPGLSFTANPAPIPLNAGSTVGQTTLSWNAPGYSSLQIFANGALFDDVGTSGSVATGNWVGDGLNFSLIDSASGAPLSTVTVHTAAANGGPVTFTANPSTITLAAGTNVGKTTLNWNAPRNSGLQIWVDGALFDAGLPASGSVDTGNWVSDGTSFALVNPATAQTIATVTVAAK